MGGVSGAAHGLQLLAAVLWLERVPATYTQMLMVIGATQCLLK